LLSREYTPKERRSLFRARELKIPADDNLYLWRSSRARPKDPSVRHLLSKVERN
jgi:hypothetical protein